jgi:hypothetical protein
MAFIGQIDSDAIGQKLQGTPLVKTMLSCAVLLLATSGVAMASQDHYRGDRDFGFHWKEHKAASVVAAPEIDPASIVAGLTLLCGGLAVLRGRRSK